MLCVTAREGPLPRIRLLMSCLIVALVACKPATTSSPKIEPQLADAGKKNTLNCELKNGPTGCVMSNGQPDRAGRGQADSSAKKAGSDQTANAASPSRETFQPWMCKQGPQAMLPVWGSLLTGNLGKFQAYCREIEGDADSETAASSEGSGGGCEWNGRDYGPGDSIYYTEGPIMSRDLKVFGQSFESLSGKSGPWQQCQCSSTSGHWGCV